MKNRRKISIIVLTILFIIILILIKTNNLVCFDNYIYNIITIKTTNLLTLFYKIFTFLGSTLFIVSLCIFFLILFIILKKKNYGLIIAITLIISTIINNLIKFIVNRKRPLVNALVVEKSSSFPSGHTMASVAMNGILIYLIWKSKLNKKLKIIISLFLSIISLLVMISRIYLGVHFATDVIGGAIVSIIILLIETYLIDKKKLI